MSDSSRFYRPRLRLVQIAPDRWRCDASSTYGGYGATRWEAVADWHNNNRQIKQLGDYWTDQKSTAVKSPI